MEGVGASIPPPERFPRRRIAPLLSIDEPVHHSDVFGLNGQLGLTPRNRATNASTDWRLRSCGGLDENAALRTLDLEQPLKDAGTNCCFAQSRGGCPFDAGKRGGPPAGEPRGADT